MPAAFALLVVSRMFVGVGEASFVALAAPFIGEHAVHLHGTYKAINLLHIANDDIKSWKDTDVNLNVSCR